MSISGKSDFEDVCDIYGHETILSKYQICVGDHDIIPLKFETEKDLIAYYPYLVSMMFADKDGGHIILSTEPYIDIEEHEHLNWKLEDVVRYYKRCKRRKEEFDKTKALELISSFGSPQNYHVELVDRVAELGDKATIAGIHDPLHDKMRDKWYHLMLDYGWSEDISYRWVYGWRRYFDKINIDKQLNIK